MEVTDILCRIGLVVKSLFYVLIFSSLFSVLASCGKSNIEVTKFELNTQNSNDKDSFYMSTNEDLVSEYEIVERINLYDIVPHLNDLLIRKESFWEIQEAIQKVAKLFNSNYAVIVKDSNCTAVIGYCNAYVLDRYINN